MASTSFFAQAPNYWTSAHTSFFAQTSEESRPTSKAPGSAKSRSTSAGSNPSSNSAASPATSSNVASAPGSIDFAKLHNIWGDQDNSSFEVTTPVLLSADTLSAPRLPSVVGPPPGLEDEIPNPFAMSFRALAESVGLAVLSVEGEDCGATSDKKPQNLSSALPPPPSGVPHLGIVSLAEALPPPPLAPALSAPESAAPLLPENMSLSLWLGPPTTPALGSPEVPTIGSVRHFEGLCKPCAFMHSKGCSNGVQCVFCHVCEPGEKQRRKKERRALQVACRNHKKMMKQGA